MYRLNCLDLDINSVNDLNKVVPYLNEKKYLYYLVKQHFYLTKVSLTKEDFNWWLDYYANRSIA